MPRCHFPDGIALADHRGMEFPGVTKTLGTDSFAYLDCLPREYCYV